MKALLKWPGGKGRELGRVQALVPGAGGRWFEPFVGGGAALFAFEPASAAVNDVQVELIELYRAVQAEDPELAAALGALTRLWDHEAAGLASAHGPGLAAWFEAEGRTPRVRLPRTLAAALVEAATAGAAAAGLGRSLGIEPAALGEAVAKSAAGKLARLRGLEAKHHMRFAGALLARQVETGLRAGIYTCLRDAPAPGAPGGRAALFFFVREYCYGSMFRQNRQGRFNIPYGGMAYDAKRLGPRVAELTSPRRRALLAGVSIECGDFRDFFARWRSRMGPEDLCFLDPPYDSDFSAYGGHSFGAEEQRALALEVARLPCRVAMIVQETPLIRSLYEPLRAARAGLTIESYAKRYTYNVRGRNARDATHLFISDGCGPLFRPLAPPPS